MLFWTFFSLFMASALFEAGLEFLNWAWMKKNSGKVPEPFEGAVEKEKLARIEAYTRDKIILGLWSDLAGKTLLVGMLLIDGFAWLSWKVELLGMGTVPAALCFFGIMALAGVFLSLPFGWYGTFRLEERYGFNRTTHRLWIIDQVKGLIIGGLIGGILLLIVIVLLYHAGTWWWLICWAAVFAFSLIITVLYPLVIAPLFNKFTPLEDGELKDSACELTTRAGIASKGVFVMDAEKRSTHTNAYFTGIGKTKRIVFYDTLLKKHTTGEALAVLAHEAGHWKKKHVWKNLVLGQAVSLSLFAATGLLVGWEALYNAFGFKDVTPYAGLFLVSIVYSPAMLFLNPLTALLSRKHEFEADRYAGIVMKKKDELCSMLVKSALDNLSNLNPHPLYVWFHYSHPTVCRRIEELKKLPSAAQTG